MNPEITRILDKLRSLERERAPSMTFDRCDAVLLLEYVSHLEGCYRRNICEEISMPVKKPEASAGN